MRDLILDYEAEIDEARKVIEALLGTIAARVPDNECVAASRELVDNFHKRWPKDRNDTKA